MQQSDTPDSQQRTWLDEKRLNALSPRARQAVLQNDGWIAELRQKMAEHTARKAEFTPFSNEWKYFDAQIRHCQQLIKEVWQNVEPYQGGNAIKH